MKCILNFSIINRLSTYGNLKVTLIQWLGHVHIIWCSLPSFKADKNFLISISILWFYNTWWKLIIYTMYVWNNVLVIDYFSCLKQIYNFFTLKKIDMKIFFIFKIKKKSVWYQLIILMTGNINSRISILYVSDFKINQLLYRIQ